MNRETELALVKRLIDGDAAAFDLVYEEYRARIYSFLVRLSRRRDVAEDLLEETWLRLIENAGRLRPDTRLDAWLFTVARNLYFSYCRSRLIEYESVAGLMGLWRITMIRPSPLEEAAAGELERRVERALSSLPARYREVLLLALVEGLTPAETASVCGISSETLRQRLLRARDMLAKELELRRTRKRSSGLREVVA